MPEKHADTLDQTENKVLTKNKIKYIFHSNALGYDSVLV